MSTSSEKRTNYAVAVRQGRKDNLYIHPKVVLTVYNACRLCREGLSKTLYSQHQIAVLMATSASPSEI